MAINVLGLGAGGHAKVVIEILQACGNYELVGLLDPKEDLHGQEVLGVPVLGGDSLLTTIADRGVECFFVGLGSTGDASSRRRLFELGISSGLRPVSAIHPLATVSPSACIGEGNTIMAGAIVNAGVVTGRNVLINTGAIVEHDCNLDDDVHVATGACLAGGVHAEAGSHIGIGAVVKEYITVGQEAIVGAGAVVVKDVPANKVVAGVPARILRER